MGAESLSPIATTIRVQTEVGVYGQNIGQIPTWESGKINCILQGLSRLEHKTPLNTIMSDKMDIAWLLGEAKLDPGKASEQLDALDWKQLYAESLQSPSLDQMVRDQKLPTFLVSAIRKAIDPSRPPTNIQGHIREFSASIHSLFTDTSVSAIKEPATVVDTVHAMVHPQMGEMEDHLDLGLPSADVATAIRSISRLVDMDLLKGGATYSTLLTMLIQYDFARERDRTQKLARIEQESARGAVSNGRLGLLAPFNIVGGGFILAEGLKGGSDAELFLGFGALGLITGATMGSETIHVIRRYGLRSLLPTIKPQLPRRLLSLLALRSEK